MKPIFSIFLPAVIFTLASCGHPVFKTQYDVAPKSCPDWDASGTKMNDAAYFSPSALTEKFKAELLLRKDKDSQDNYPYLVGLALSGGGAKSASYSMGVLQGLYKNNILQKNVDLISSDSGGGYAALWYFSRLADIYLGVPSVSSNPTSIEKNYQPFNGGASHTFFEECLPSRYAGLCTSDDNTEECRNICPAKDDRWLSPDQEDRWRHQNHLRGYTDVLSNDFNMDTDKGLLNVDVAKAVGLTAVTLPAHWFSNILFDWKLSVSPSQHQYRLGIERTYGLAPVNIKKSDCENQSSDCVPSDVLQDTSGSSNYFNSRPMPNRLVSRGLTFSTLQAARIRQSREWQTHNGTGIYSQYPFIPFWVINTTAGVSNTPFDLFEEDFPDFEDSIFEFTPTGYGSGLYGYWPGAHPEVDVVAAISASAAFFDSQQRSMSWPGRFATGTTLRFLQLEWGLDIANPAQPDRMRGRHAFLPFPFYYLHRATKNSKSPYIHLSDGGQSDNTGIFSLVRRGVKTIIFADAGQDIDGNYADLCVLRRQLKKRSLHLYLPELSKNSRSFSRECDSETDDRDSQTKSHDLWAMKKGVLHGCITRNKEDESCTSENTEGYRADLYVLKPSIDINQVKDEIVKCRKSLINDKLWASLATPTCHEQLVAAREKASGLPVEIFGFLVHNWDKKNQTGDSHPIFPQHKTWKMTLNSSSWLYGAYKALGDWHVEQLLAANPGILDYAE